jgi:tRNA U34 5-methylaminomethyl-2-thiouridine-forming methyltransferase MnmC
MERKIIMTKDGSASISIPEMNVTYHSIHGAIQESLHVFIEAGLLYLINKSPDKPSAVLDLGFGTGLNAILTAIEAEKADRSFYYVALEPYPLTQDEVLQLNYCELLGRKDLQEDFIKMHQLEANKGMALSENILMHKSDKTLQAFEHKTTFDLIYYDAFAPAAQPELWTKNIFEKLYNLMSPEGLLVTYCSKGDVQRAMKAAGFKIEKIPGPIGKREMIRAKKVPG